MAKPSSLEKKALDEFWNAQDYVDQIKGFGEVRQGIPFFVVRDLNRLADDGLGTVMSTMKGNASSSEAEAMVREARDLYIVKAVMEVVEKDWLRMRSESVGGGGFTAC